MAVSYELCGCGKSLVIPSAWTLFTCAVCQRIYERCGGIWYPRREAKVGAAATKIPA